ncbi:MAG: chloride channel protein [Acidobacteriota bacterium]|nr:chloride channel protein [Acidobacteriota bacterium]
MKRATAGNKIWEALTRWMDIRQLRQHEDKVLLVLTLLIGAIVGLVIVAFILLTENLGARMYPAGGAAWRRLVVPVAGSLITGFLLFRYFPGARGSGIPQTKAALFLHSGVIHLRTVLGKFWCSSVSLASGIALGREGPSVQVGAGIASVLGRQFGLSPTNAKALVPIGASAALAAAFNTPIAAVLFTLEEVLGNLHARVLGAIVISSATSWMVLHLLLGDEPLFHVPGYQLVHPVEFLFYAALGVLGGLISTLFVKLLLWLRKRFSRMPAWTAPLQPVAGGLLVGILGLFIPAVLGVGYSHVSDALNNRLALGTMVLLVALKLIATATCYASGNAGGIFGPSLFIGAMMGGAFGAGAHLILPDYTGSVGAYALVGMGVAFAGIIRAPMTSVIMIFEITRDYSIIVPLMIANLMSYFIASRLQKRPIYQALMDQDGMQLPATPRDRDSESFISQLQRTPERTLQSTDSIQDVLAKPASAAAMLPVLDGDLFLGMVTIRQLQDAANLGKQGDSVATVLPEPRPDTGRMPEQDPRVFPDQPVDVALRRMEQSGFNTLPVVDRTEPQKLAGIVSLSDILASYDLGGETPSSREILPTAKARPVAIGGIVAVLCLTIGIAGFLSYYYRSQRAERAEQFALSGDALMQRGRYQEAIEQYRSALSISHSSKDRLALAGALIRARRWNEAEIYLKDLFRESPDSGPVNLGLGRIAVQRGDVQSAIDSYRKSIYGQWPPSSEADRTSIRMELIDFLAKSDRLRQARVELLSLIAESQEDIGIRKRASQLLLRYGFPDDAAQALQEILKKAPADAEAFAGLGQAQFALGNFSLAQRAFRSALTHNPDDVQSMKQLELTEQILALDPNLRGLRLSERYERSRKLLAATLQSLDRCLAQKMMVLSASESDTLRAARKSLAAKKKPRSYGDAVETNISLADQIWSLHLGLCGEPTAAEEWVRRFMAQRSQ